jgi:hypothetical protein
MAKKKPKKGASAQRPKQVDARLAGNARRQGGEDRTGRLIRAERVRPAPPAAPRKPRFTVGSTEHRLTYVGRDGAKTTWRCACGKRLTVEHRQREDAGERIALDAHCRKLTGMPLDARGRLAARAPARPAGEGPPLQWAKVPKLPRSKRNPKGSGSPLDGAGTTGRVTPAGRRPSRAPVVLPWQQAPAEPADVRRVPVRLCSSCGLNELNCGC